MISVVVPTIIWAAYQPVNWWAFAAQVFFVFNWVQITAPTIANLTMPGSGVVWSLGVEEQFYLVFAIIWSLLTRIRRPQKALMVICAVCITYSTVARYLCADVDSLRFVRATDTRLDSIAWGVLAAVVVAIYQRGDLAWLRALGSDWAILVAVSLILLSAVLPEQARFLVFTIQSIGTAIAITYGLMPDPSRLRNVIYSLSTWKPISIVGLASYSIYLTHDPMILLLKSMHLYNTVTIVAGILVGALVGIVMWRLVEVPALRWKTKLIEKLWPPL
jgi:peptidoglycan/LPS O-acetylase OafA/YrhL